MEVVQILKWVGGTILIFLMIKIAIFGFTGHWPGGGFNGPCYSTRADYDC